MGGRGGGDTPAFGGNWTEEKLDILEKYLDAYTTALKNKPFRLVYLDAFAGAGEISLDSGNGSHTDERDSRAFIVGSAARAIRVDDRPFDRLVFVEKDRQRFRQLKRLCDQHEDRDIDPKMDEANAFLCRLRQGEYGNWRGVLFVDPYGAQLAWSTVERIAQLERLDMWLLFPVGTIGRLLPRLKDPAEVDAGWTKRLTRVYGGESWRGLYSPPAQRDLFVTGALERAPGLEDLLKIYKNQLKGVFGPRFLNESRTLKNSKNTPLYEFIFCAGHPNGASIAKRIAKHLITDISKNP